MADIFQISQAIEKHITAHPFDRAALEEWLSVAIQLGRSSPQARVAVEKIKLYVQHALTGGVRDLEELSRWRTIFGQCLLFESHYLVDSYFQYMEWNRDPRRRFFLPRRKQLKPMIDAFQQIMDDEIDLMTISTPPGVGKTTAAGLFITMLMGLYPDDYNLASAHSDTLTRSLYDGILGFISDRDEYTWHEIFPNMEIESTNANNQTINIGRPNRFKSFTARSIRGTLTGPTRANRLLYSDDLVSGIEEALNKERLDKLWEFYTNNLKSRGTGAFKELHVATRWSIHDPIGRLMRIYDGQPRAKFITMPALDENDESNFDYDCQDRFTTKTYHDIRGMMDEVSWRCLYMNEPIEREGMVFPEQELRRFYDLPNEKRDPQTGEILSFDPPDAILAVCDTKDKGKDYSVMPIVYVYGEDHYVVDAVCDQGVSGKVEARLVEKLLSHGVQAARFESNSSGGRIADGVNAELKARGGITHITKKFTSSNKETRIVVAAQWVIDNCLFKTKNLYNAGDDYGRMMRFLTSYSLSAKNTYDDVPDAFSMYFDFSNSLHHPAVSVVKNPLWGRR